MSTSLLASHHVWQGEGARCDARARGLIEVEGQDAEDFLQRLGSQDVRSVADGRAAPTAFLNPKGKVLALAWIARLGARFLLDVPARQLAEVAELLERYHFTERLTVRALPAGRCTLVVGARAHALAGVAPGCARERDGLLLLSLSWRGHPFVHCHVPSGGALPASLAEVPQLTAEQADAVRIAMGLVEVGIDTDSGTLAPEAALEPALSTTKGCYTGQEIVARIATYGHVNRRLAAVAIATSTAPPLGTLLCEREEGDAVGRVFSSAPAFGGPGRIALAYLPLAFTKPGTELALATRDGAAVQVLDFGPEVASAT